MGAFKCYIWFQIHTKSFLHLSEKLKYMLTRPSFFTLNFLHKWRNPFCSLLWEKDSWQLNRWIFGNSRSHGTKAHFFKPQRISWRQKSSAQFFNHNVSWFKYFQESKTEIFSSKNLRIRTYNFLVRRCLFLNYEENERCLGGGDG